MIKLFVYGTLKRGCRNHHVLESVGAHYLGDASVPGVLHHMGAFPGLHLLRGDAPTVKGEVFEVPEEALPRLDRFERCPVLYRRESVNDMQTYVIQPSHVDPGHEVIAGGVWVE